MGHGVADVITRAGPEIELTWVSVSLFRRLTLGSDPDEELAIGGTLMCAMVCIMPIYTCSLMYLLIIRSKQSSLLHHTSIISDPSIPQTASPNRTSMFDFKINHKINQKTQ